MSSIIMDSKSCSNRIVRNCAVCQSKAIGINFGAPSCAPCKAFFRRNARRKEVVDLPCQFSGSDSIERSNENISLNDWKICSQIRHCTSCRIRQCFRVGMKIELIRTDEERQRYRQLVESNRQRRNQISKEQIRRKPTSNDPNLFLTENDWLILSNVVNSYETFCLKKYVEKRRWIFQNEILQSKEDKHFYVSPSVNKINSFLSFLSSIPVVQKLSNVDRIYLCKNNIYPLIFPNNLEIEQTCFSEPWQVEIENRSAEFIFGKTLFNEYLQIKTRAETRLINDPVVTRLWFLILFFSTPLNCYQDKSLPNSTEQRIFTLNQIQQSFIVLLWKYILHRHEQNDAVNILSNLIRIYLEMQRLSQKVALQIETRSDLIPFSRALNEAIFFDQDRI